MNIKTHDNDMIFMYLRLFINVVYIKIIFYKITSLINYPICFYLAISIAVTILFPPERPLLNLCLPFGYYGLAILDVVAVFFVYCHDSGSCLLCFSDIFCVHLNCRFSPPNVQSFVPPRLSIAPYWAGRGCISRRKSDWKDLREHIQQSDCPCLCRE